MLSLNRRRLIPISVFVALHAEFDQLVEQSGVILAGGLPQHAVHGDGCEAGHGVDLVEVNSVVALGIEQEIHPRKPVEVEGQEGLDGQVLQTARLFWANVGRNLGLLAFGFKVLGLVVVEVTTVHDLAGQTDLRSVVAQNGQFDFSGRLQAFFDEDLAVETASLINALAQLFAVAHFGDSHRRAEVAGLHEGWIASDIFHLL